MTWTCREARVDVVGDGEMGKIGYSTYVTDRLIGFENAQESSSRPPDLAEFLDVKDNLTGRGSSPDDRRTPSPDADRAFRVDYDVRSL